MKITIKLFILSCVIGLSLLANQNFRINREILNLFESLSTKKMFKLWHYALNKPYDINSEFGLKKYKIFKENWKFIQEHNLKYPKTVLGLTPFVDMTWEEFKEGYVGGYDVDMSKFIEISEKEKDFSFDEMADLIDADENFSFDTTQKREKVTYKQNLSPDWSPYFLDTPHQGKTCHSCWAFATIGAVEAYVASQGSPKVRLSVKQLIDCPTTNRGCLGGRIEFALQEIMKNGGVVKESDYAPYNYSSELSNYTEKSDKCNKSAPFYLTVEKVEECSDYKLVSTVPRCNKAGKDKSDVEDIVKKGPAATGIEVKHGTQFYRQGDWLHYDCKVSNHAVIISGILEDGVWIRNSWGPNWGIESPSGLGGYGRIPFNQPGTLKACGALNEAHRVSKFKLN